MPPRRNPRPTAPRRSDPRWLAAPLLLAVAAAGALSGKAIGSVSMLRPSDDRLAVASPGPAPFAPDRSAQEQLPDHYPLVTPTGTVPVVALSLHGRLRQTSDSWADAHDRVPLEAEDDWELSEAEIDHLAQWQPTRSALPRPRVAADRPAPAPTRAELEAAAPVDSPSPTKTPPSPARPEAPLEPHVAAAEKVPATPAK